MSMKKVILNTATRVGLGIITWAFYICGFSQANNLNFYKQLIILENASIPTEQKLTEALRLKTGFEEQRLVKDSVYARILHKTGLFAFLSNREVATADAISFTVAAIRINSAGKKSSA